MRKFWRIFGLVFAASAVVVAVVLWITDEPVNHSLFFIIALNWFLALVDREDGQ